MVLNKSPDFDNIHVNTVSKSYNKSETPLFYIFQQSIKFGVFLDKTKKNSIFKFKNKSSLSNYRSISVPPCFCKVLKKMSNKQSYPEEKIDFSKILLNFWLLTPKSSSVNLVVYY